MCVVSSVCTCVCDQLTRIIVHRVLDEDLGQIRRHVWWAVGRIEMSSAGGMGLV